MTNTRCNYKHKKKTKKKRQKKKKNIDFSWTLRMQRRFVTFECWMMLVTEPIRGENRFGKDANRHNQPRIRTESRFRLLLFAWVLALAVWWFHCGLRPLSQKQFPTRQYSTLNILSRHLRSNWEHFVVALRRLNESFLGFSFPSFPTNIKSNTKPIHCPHNGRSGCTIH